MVCITRQHGRFGDGTTWHDEGDKKQQWSDDMEVDRDSKKRGLRLSTVRVPQSSRSEFRNHHSFNLLGVCIPGIPHITDISTLLIILLAVLGII